MPGACLNPWQTYECEWGVGYLWRWMNWITRLDVFVLALMLAYVVVVFTRVSYRYHVARRSRDIDTASPAFLRTRRKLVADLSAKAGNVKSIAFVAPYLGLAGTCMLSAFRGFAMQRQAAMAMMTFYIAASLITTAAGLLVAVPATWSYNYLRTRIDLLASEISGNARRNSGHSQVARSLLLTPRFSKLPFAVIAAPVLAIVLVVFLTFTSYRWPRGLEIGLASADCVSDLADRLIVLHITDERKVFINYEQEDWNNLAGRLSEIYSMRVHRTLYLR